jgi:hypothetical protein
MDIKKLVTVQGRMALVTAQLLLKGKDESPNVTIYLVPTDVRPDCLIENKVDSDANLLVVV